MVIYALIAMACFDVRTIGSKIPCKEMGTPLFVEVNFLTEFVLGLLVILMSKTGLINLSFSAGRTFMLAFASLF